MGYYGVVSKGSKNTLSKYAASHSIGFAGLSFTKLDMPSNSNGTTVWSKYARIGSACKFNLSSTSSICFSDSFIYHTFVYHTLHHCTYSLLTVFTSLVFTGGSSMDLLTGAPSSAGFGVLTFGVPSVAVEVGISTVLLVSIF